jgi:DNA-directed RNA polymerase subunit beta'
MAHLDHKEAFNEFRERVLEGIKTHFPVQGRTHTLELDGLEVKDEGLHADDIRAQHQAKVSGESWSAPVWGNMVLRDNATGKVTERKKVRLAELPMTTRRYSYIVDGSEYQVDNQWQLKPGVYTRRRQSGELETRFNVPNKRPFDVVFYPEKKAFYIDRGSSKAIPVYPIMKALGVDDDTLKQSWGKEVFEASKAARGTANTLAKFYKVDKGEAPKSQADAEKYLIDTLRDSKLRPEATKVTLGKPFTGIDGEVLTLATAKMLKVHQGAPEDDRDSLVFKDLRGLGDFAHDKLTDSSTKSAIKNKIIRQLNTGKGIRQAVKFGTFNIPIRETFTKNSAARTADQINPVEMVASSMQTTLMGPGGIQSAHVNLDEAKLVNPSHLGFLDPLHTPENDKTGVILHLPVSVEKVGKDPKIPVHNLKTNKTDWVTPQQFMSSSVVLPDQVRWDGNKPTPISKNVKMALPGNALAEGKFSDAQYVMKHPSQMLSITTNLVPFVNSNSGGRASYATHHIEQAISLKHREEPLVQVGTGSSGWKTFEDLVGGISGHAAPVSGKVVAVKKDAVHVEGADGKVREVQLYNNFPLNDPKAVLHSEPVVKVGDSVKSGQLVADTNFTKGGKLALGTNLRVAYLPYKGYNFDDGVVISQSAANKLASVHLYKPSTRLTPDTITRADVFKDQHPEAFTKDQFSILNDEGLVRVGQVVKPGDPLVLATRPYNLRDRSGAAAIRRSLSGAHTDTSLRWDADYPGEVVGVHKNKDGTVAVHVRTTEPMQVGDKVSGRHGNKGIVTQVLPDHEMPHTADGKHIEVALNPAGVPGRINVGQVLETVAGKIAQKTGKPYIVENFMHGPDNIGRMKKELKEHGLTDTEELHDPTTGVKLGKALVGPQYMLKLMHQIDKKDSARSGMDLRGTAPEGYDLNLMPVGGGHSGAQSIGNLGMYTMLAHGAKANIREMQTWKSEGPDAAPDGKRWPSQHEEVWRAIQTGDALPPPRPTFAFQKFTDMLRGAGVNIEKKGHRFQLTPLTDKQILKMSNAELPKPADLTYTKLDKNGEPVPKPGGLFDPKLTGGHSGKHWTHFTLAEPMPNPVFEAPIQRILNITKGQYSDLINSNKAVHQHTGEFVPVGSADSITGGAAVVHMLGKVDVQAELKKAQEDLAKAPVPKAIQFGAAAQKMDTALKKVKYLKALDELSMSPKDAYALHHIPVLPPAMRPASVLPDGNVRWADLNGLYSDLASLNDEMKHKDFKSQLTDHDKKEQRASLYDGVKALMGIGANREDREGKAKGILLQISGKSPKEGYFQNTLLSRRQDLTMRSTIVPEPAMGLDQVGLPSEKAVTLFRPFVVKKMVDIGAAPHPLEAQKMLASKDAHKNSQVLRALDLVMEDRPVLLKRDPVLHKHGIMAFNAHRVPGKAIQIHPLVTGGYNADFDGDAMSVYVPISPDAVQEARKMFPSNNLFNESTGHIMNAPTHESALGLYKLARIGTDTGKKFKDPAEALKAVDSGSSHINDLVHVNGVGKTTPGRLLLSSAVPEALRSKVLTDHSMTLDKKGIAELYKNIAVNHTKDFGEVANKLKDLGYGMSYGALAIRHPDHTGSAAIHAAEDQKNRVKFLPTGTHSFSLDDFAVDKASRDPVIKSTQKKVDSINASSISQSMKDARVIDEWQKATGTIADLHKAHLQNNKNTLHEMSASGLKPSWDQYRQIKLAPMLMNDASGRVIPTPVTKSYAEGLDMFGYWTQMHGQRKGAVAKVQEVREPGYFTKQLINTTMNLVVNGHDCGTQRGVALPITSNDVHDRELVADIKVRNQVFPKGTVLSPDVVSQIRTLDKNAQVAVRSPLKCEHGKGICQKCAGLSASGSHYDMGTNVGILASQSLGERSTQLALRVFHTGGVAGGGGKLIGQFGRVQQLTKLPERIPDEAALAMHAGKIEKVEHSKLGSTVTINGQEHFVPLDRGGRRLTDPLPGLNKVRWEPPKVGMTVKAGDVLSDPNRTFVNPHTLYKATGNMEAVQNHLVNELHSLYSSEGIRRQNVEMLVKGMSNLTRVIEPGHAEGILKGEYHPTSVIRQMNKELATKGKKPVQHAPILKGVDVLPLHLQEDWMAKMNFERLRGSVMEAAATNAYSDIHGLHPIPGMAYGAEFGMTEKKKHVMPHVANVPGHHY